MEGGAHGPFNLVAWQTVFWGGGTMWPKGNSCFSQQVEISILFLKALISATTV